MKDKSLDPEETFVLHDHGGGSNGSEPLKGFLFSK
jgi:hypothetical protein